MDGSFILVPGETSGTEPPRPPHGSAGWWGKFAGWFWQPEETEKDDLWADWEYIASGVETWAAEQSRREVASLATIQAANPQQMRPMFIQAARAAFASLSPEEADELRASPLASDKRASIIGEIVRRLEQRWLLRFLARFFAGAPPDARASFQGSFFEMPYAKNIIGAVVRNPALSRFVRLKFKFFSHRRKQLGALRTDRVQQRVSQKQS